MSRYIDQKWRDLMRIHLDYNNTMYESLGKNGIEYDELYRLKHVFARAADNMLKKRGEMAWRELPHNQDETVKKIISAAQRIRSDYECFVVFGIGGSALGPIAVQYALSHLKYNDLPDEKRGGPRIYIEDNIDPERFKALTDVIDVSKTCFCVITKSGSTSETMSQLLLITDLLKKNVGTGYEKQLIAITDSKKGNLIKIAKALNLETFYIPEGVGGRFCELSPVGLLPAAVCGIDIVELLMGAAYMDELCAEENVFKNPAYMSAVLEYVAMGKNCNISVMMPYAESLRYFADWYAQLWAESLGKIGADGQRVGQTPVKALGVTDQHSQVQLYTDGPFDKVITFLGVDRYGCEVMIPHAYDHIEDVAFLSGHTLNELIKSEQIATEYAIVKSGHLSKSITMPEVNAFTVGQLIYMLEVQTAFAGELLEINAFDQPGVEEGKNATYALLGKKGYDEKRAELLGRPKKEKRYII